MNRAEMALYLDATYPALIAVAFPTTGGYTYTADGTFAPVIDAALRAQGVAEGDLSTYITDDTSPTRNGDTLALCDYYALRLIWRQLGIRVTTAVGPLRKDYEQQFANVATLLKDAERDITHRGYGPDALQMGRVQLDIFEPQQVQGYTQNPWVW